MHKVVTINLNGRAFQFDDNAYDALRAYLDRAETQLASNPDRTEILGDLEQAIAEKCQRFLDPHKTVINLAEITVVLDEMGPVDTGAAEGAETAHPSTEQDRPKSRPEPEAPRRLYRVGEGAILGGVCAGIAAFTHLDVTIVRVIALLLAIIEVATVHSGVVLILYVVLMFVVPEANTSEERAAAHGAPFNAQEVIDRAKRMHERFRDKEWQSAKKEWHSARREWRRQQREWKRQWNAVPYASSAPWWATAAIPPPAGYGARILAGLTMPLLTLLNAVVFWFAAFAVLSLVRNGEIQGWRLPPDIPLWVGILGLILFVNAIGWPLHAARRASYYALGGPHYGWFAAWDGVLSLGFGVLIVWFGYHYVPAVRDIVQHLPDIWNTIRDAARR